MNNQKMNKPYGGNTGIEAPTSDKTRDLARESQLAQLLEDDKLVCAHVYDDDGYTEYLFHGSP